MAFYSLHFFLFIIFFIFIHDLAREIVPKYQWVVRLIASLFFFIYMSGIKVVFLLASAITIWSGALLLHQISENNRIYRSREGLSKEEKKASRERCVRTKKIYTAGIIAFNLGLLILVKYLFPVTGHPIALPLGISFYTLQAVSYIVDVYGEKYEPQKNPAKLALYLCWFPQLIQGPINRYDLVKEDLYKTFRMHAPDLRVAVYMFLFGAVKKYAVADLLAPVVRSALGNSSAGYPGSFAFLGALFFAVQQYCDFSGGIDMSMGISLLFGVKMNENFRQPYFATSLAEFWRRWHITLGSFMRDYVFYPFVTTKPISKMTKAIGKKFGNHASRSITGGISNIIVFALVGLWHGPEHHYLAWGLYNGIIIAASDALSPVFGKLNKLLHIREDSKGMYVFRIIRTFLIVTFAGYFDVIGPIRVGIGCFVNTFLHFDIAGGLAMTKQLFTNGVTSVQALVTAGIALILLIINSVYKERGAAPLSYVCSLRYYKRWIVYFSLLILLLYSFSVSSGVRGFMYAAF